MHTWEMQEHIRREGYDTGYDTGFDTGVDKGVDKARIEAIKNLMETTEKGFEEVCYMLKLSEEDMLRYKDAV